MIAADVAGYKTSKGALQFDVDAPLPPNLVRTLIDARRREVGARSRAGRDSYVTGDHVRFGAPIGYRQASGGRQFAGRSRKRNNAARNGSLPARSLWMTCPAPSITSTSTSGEIEA